jgi:hypothetical protein
VFGRRARLVLLAYLVGAALGRVACQPSSRLPSASAFVTAPARRALQDRTSSAHFSSLPSDPDGETVAPRLLRTGSTKLLLLSVHRRRRLLLLPSSLAESRRRDARPPRVLALRRGSRPAAMTMLAVALAQAPRLRRRGGHLV